MQTLKQKVLKDIRYVGTGCRADDFEKLAEGYTPEQINTVVKELHQAGMITVIRTATNDFYYPVQLINVLCDVTDTRGDIRLTEGHTYTIKDSNDCAIWVMCDLGFKYRLVKGSKKYENVFDF